LFDTAVILLDVTGVVRTVTIWGSVLWLELDVVSTLP